MKEKQHKSKKLINYRTIFQYSTYLFILVETDSIKNDGNEEIL